MRKLVAILAVALMFGAAACTPEEAAKVIRQYHIDHPDPVPVKTSSDDAGANFLRLMQMLHNDPFLACTRGHESDTAGGYRAYNPSGPYYGAYQFLQGTWNNSAAHGGMHHLVGVNILEVPGFYQDMVADTLHKWQGKSPWGSRC